ncbi:MAG: DUF1698 domain-containing protein [Patescibacteria group bacterium]|nr:DUF1698 domain-containing protein [Patescibacteria group bacterium]
MLHRQITKLPKFFFNLYEWLLIRSYPRYQPVFYRGKLTAGSDRDCLDRWKLIKEEIKKFKIKTVVDIGCAEGFYVLQSAKECGCLSLGVEADIRRLSMAQSQTTSEKIMPAGFLLAEVDEQFIEKMPAFDLVIFMSVMHHLMYSRGEEYCRNLLNKLRGKINKVMIFEMGQSDELENAWAAKLPDMGSDPHQWIAVFLKSAGFSEVTKIGESDSYKKDKNRAIFRAVP